MEKQQVIKKVKRSFSCPYCSKSYQRKLYYDRHYSCCKLLHTSNKKNNLIDLEESGDIPTRRELYIMVQELSSKYELLLKHTTKLQSYVYRKKKQINLLEWLKQDCIGSKHMIPKYDMDLKKWLANIDKDEEKVFNMDVLNCVFENGDILSTMIHVIKQYETTLHTKEIFRVFIINGFGDNEKENITCRKVYVYDDNDWRIFKKDEIHNLEYMFSKILLKRFKEWQIKYQEAIIENKQNMGEIYQKNLQIVMGGSLRRDQIKKKFHQLFASYVLKYITNELEIKE